MLIVMRTASRMLSSRLSNGRPKIMTAKYRMCRIMGAITVASSFTQKTTLKIVVKTHSWRWLRRNR
jgi:hypothetical protein